MVPSAGCASQILGETMKPALLTLATMLLGSFAWGAYQDPRFASVVLRGGMTCAQLGVPVGAIAVVRKYGALRLIKRGVNGAFAAAWTIAEIAREIPGEFVMRWPGNYERAKGVE